MTVLEGGVQCSTAASTILKQGAKSFTAPSLGASLPAFAGAVMKESVVA